MSRYRLVGSGTRRSFVSLEDKVKAIADIYLRQLPARDVLSPLYQRANRMLPKNPTIILSNWRKSIQDKLDAEDGFTIDLCKQNGVIVEAPGQKRRNHK